MKRFEFVEGSELKVGSRTLRRIRASVDMPWHNVKVGDLGGYLEKESNLDGNTWVYGDAKVGGNAKVSGDAVVCGNAWVHGNAKVYGNAMVHGNAKVYGNAKVSGDVEVSGDAKVYGNAEVSGDVEVSGNAKVSGDAKVSGGGDYLLLGPAKSSGRFTTAHLDTAIGVRINCGCFSGSLDEFKAAVEETHKDNPEFLKQYRSFYACIDANF